MAAAEVLRRERAREHEIGDLRKRCDDLERYQQQLTGAAGLEANAKVAAGAVREAQKKFDAADRHHADLTRPDALSGSGSEGRQREGGCAGHAQQGARRAES